MAKIISPFGISVVGANAIMLFLLPFSIVLQSANSFIQNPYHLPFDYHPTSDTGPLDWDEVVTEGNEWEKYVDHEMHNLDRVLKNQCHRSRRQSPINLIANLACTDTHEILTRKIKEGDCKFESLTFSITPHTLRADFPYDDSTCERPTVDLPNGYPFTWYAHHIEIHLRSEHVLDGRRFDGEMQMYHLGREDQKRELASVSVLLDASGYEDNAKLQQYIDEWEKLEHEIKQACMNGRRRVKKSLRPVGSTKKDAASMTFRAAPAGNYTNLTQGSHYARTALETDEHKDSRELQDEEETLAPRRKMFPYDIWPSIHFFRYRGSLTAPPCTEFVSHRVLDEPLVISRRQFKTLARLLTSYTNEDTCQGDTAASPTGETFRPLQPLNHETLNLTHCTEENFSFRLYKPNQV